jgi:hypothetical protein
MASRVHEPVQGVRCRSFDELVRATDLGSDRAQLTFHGAAHLLLVRTLYTYSYSRPLCGSLLDDLVWSLGCTGYFGSIRSKLYNLTHSSRPTLRASAFALRVIRGTNRIGSIPQRCSGSGASIGRGDIRVAAGERTTSPAL